MKKVFIGGLVLIIGTALGGFVASQVIEKPEIRTTLSDRAKEYLAAKKSGSTLGTMYISEEKKSLPVGQRIAVDDCFSFVVPFAVQHKRRDTACNYYFQIQNPRGSIVAFQKKVSLADWENVPGVSMRRRTPWTYTEKDLKINGQDILLFTSHEKGLYHWNAFYRSPDSYTVINVEASTNDNIDQKVEEMLRSVELK